MGVGAQQIQVLAEYPNGTFLENLTTTRSGALLVTSYLSKTLELIEHGKPARTFVQLPVHPVSIVKTASGYILSAHGAPFTRGPAFTQMQQVLVLDEAAKILATIPAPEARFLNGGVLLADGSVLFADSIAGTIWKFDPAQNILTAWLRDPLLAQDSQSKDFRPGANGLKLQGQRLIVSNSSLGQLTSIEISADGRPKSALTIVAKTGPIDDFHVTKEGDILFTTHGAMLKRLRPIGTIDIVMASGCDGCTSIEPTTNAKGETGYAVLTTGGLLEGGKQPARVLFVRP
jgi:hypothetical protein